MDSYQFRKTCNYVLSLLDGWEGGQPDDGKFMLSGRRRQKDSYQYDGTNIEQFVERYLTLGSCVHKLPDVPLAPSFHTG